MQNEHGVFFFQDSIERSLIVVCFTDEQTVTISVVIPTVLKLNSHLRKIKESARFCRGLVTALTSSLQKQFIGIFKTSYIKKPPAEIAHLQLAFGQSIYIIATTLDPRFALDSLNEDVIFDKEDDIDVQRIRSRIKCTVESNTKVKTY